jgi:hypothetical protein
MAALVPASAPGMQPSSNKAISTPRRREPAGMLRCGGTIAAVGRRRPQPLPTPRTIT